MRTFTSGVEKELKQMGENACQLVNSVAPPESFYQGAKGIVSLFNKAKNGDFSGINLYGSYVSSFLDGKYCSSKASGTDKNSIENAAPELIDYYHQIQNVIEKNAEAYNFIKILYAPLKKISVAQQIKSEVDDVKKRSSTMLLREFNEIISHHLRNEPAPFIYEKIGERYRHYFIDEFQDTSHLQWENLKHLVFNQIAGSGSALIVGDAKQAIYRWRGGDSEQFIDLCEGKTELPNEQLKVQDLDTNYRSSGVIVDFTNQFFSACTPFLSDEKYQNLYLQGNRQKSKKTFNGFVSITDIQGKTESERTPLILDSVINEIKRVLSDGFSYRDIAILYRSNAVGGKIASALAEKGIPIVSTESLLLSESSYVGFAIAVLRFVNNPTDRLSRASILNYLEKTGKLIGFDVTQYKAKSITSATKVFLDTISSVVSGFNADTLFSSPLYEMVEYIMHVFSLWDNGQDAYLLRLLDYVEEFSSQNASSVSSFLSHWDKVKEKISISSPSDADAVRLLTIHKSKGLEYPVVIFPFASWNIKEDEEVWVKPPKNDIFNALPTSYIKLSDVKKAGLTDVASPYESKIKLDNMNIFYVAMTRPSHQLHIITTINEKSGISQCFSMFLDKTPACHDQDPDNIYVYSCGERRLEKKDPDKVSTTYILKNMGCVLWKDRLKVSLSWKKPWSTTGESAIEYGNKLHEILSSVDTSDDVEIAVGRAVVSGTIDQSRVDDVVSAVKSIVTHPLLKDYYSSEYTAMNERELLTPDGDTLRPDRVCLNGKNAVVIDYKTGAPKNAHKNQVLSYTSVLQSIGYSVEKCLLVYINDKGIMVEQV